jgi:elongation factor G
METNDNLSKVRAHVPLSEMFGYATDIRNRTKGQGSFVMELYQYEEVPNGIASGIVNQVSAQPPDARKRAG